MPRGLTAISFHPLGPAKEGSSPQGQEVPRRQEIPAISRWQHWATHPTCSPLVMPPSDLGMGARVRGLDKGQTQWEGPVLGIRMFL